jgi:hypothetical protein
MRGSEKEPRRDSADARFRTQGRAGGNRRFALALAATALALLIAAAAAFGADTTATTLTFNPVSPITYGDSTDLSGQLANTVDSSPGTGDKTINLSVWDTSGCTGTSTTTGLSATSTQTTAGSGSPHNWGPVTYLPHAAGTVYVKASFAGQGSALTASSACEPLTIDKANTATTATPSATQTTPNVPITVDYEVSSDHGVSGNNATGDMTVPMDSGPGNWNCAATQASLSAPETTGTGFDFTSDADGNYNDSNSSGQSLDVIQTVQVCPAAPAIAADYMRSTLGIKPGSKKWKDVITAVAHETGKDGMFFAKHACDPGYAHDVKDYVDYLLDPPSAAKKARGKAATKVTIKYNGDGFEGKVKSSKAKCLKNRTVKVYKQKGSSQDPSTDQKLYKDTTDKEGHWDTGTSGQAKGKFYAFAKRSTGCKKGYSKTIKV